VIHGVLRYAPETPASGKEMREMSLDSKIRVIAGTFVLASLALGWFVSPWWFLFTAFVGVNLFQSGITRWCLMEDILRWTGLHEQSRP
jgi:Inner membrane protein YgaP-like, transmembrane domain